MLLSQNRQNHTGLTEIDPWNNFLKETFLRDNIIDGILLLTFNGKHTYSFGELTHVLEEEYSQFVGIFDFNDKEKESRLFQNGFRLQLNCGGAEIKQKFVIRKKTFHSVYATSKHNDVGLVVVNLPFGVLIASHSHPVTSAVASVFVESAAELLRM